MLSIPGTHDSMTDKLEDSSKQTQNVPLTQQLTGGVRYIDITCRYINDDMKVYKGLTDTGYSLGDLLTTLFSFLNQHPREAIILRIHKGGMLDDSKTFLKFMEGYLLPSSAFSDRAAQEIYFTSVGNTTVPTIGEVRGKILILQDFKTSPPGLFGIPWNSHTISSYNQQFSPGSLLLSLKWRGVKSHISRSRSKDYDKLRITHTTASTGAKPVKVAAKKGLGVGMNRYLGKYLLFGEGNCFGIIVMDFPGYVLVDEILKLNHLYQVPESSDFPSDRIVPDVIGGFGFEEVSDYDEISDGEGPPAETSDDENSNDQDTPAFIR
ncbi:1-phosphatidylinositol phosphodiesterase [Ceratocystis platani]|uniref:1-phosphatidylinositol phosphodiesterase n=1 Tax=Ceratocystis fimbriata f. sp. platani TaxID=88771 RepID=A0A0F8AZ71_CERFI|nr:1-phosphatidylinositol phosphodiesterase [Ceratocystis platani]